MPVTWAIDDFKQPLGELTPDLYPLGDIDALLTGWLAQATAKVLAAAGIAVADHDSAAASWVYYRAYTHIAQRMNSEPEQVRAEGEIAMTTKADQRKYFADRAAAALLEFASYNVSESNAALGAAIGQQSVAIPNVPVW